MGIDHTTYFGVYFECQWKGTPAKKQVYRCSIDSQHSVRSEHNFCPTCGGKIENTTVLTGEIVPDIDYSVIQDAINDRIYEVSVNGKPQTDYWISNILIPELNREDSIGKYGETVMEITDDLIHREKKIVSDYFANELKILKEQYQEVRVIWGILAYCC